MGWVTLRAVSSRTNHRRTKSLLVVKIQVLGRSDVFWSATWFVVSPWGRACMCGWRWLLIHSQDRDVQILQGLFSQASLTLPHAQSSNQFSSTPSSIHHPPSHHIPRIPLLNPNNIRFVNRRRLSRVRILDLVPRQLSRAPREPVCMYPPHTSDCPHWH